MQTFLPYIGEYENAMAIYEESAALLDQKRLGKQRVETLQIMKALITGKGWIHHPVTKMWAGYEWSLLMYQWAICEEWVHNFGFKDTCFVKTAALYFDNVKLTPETDHSDPPWLGNKAFHLAHQSNLVRKDPEYYGKKFPNVPDDLPYIYPTLKEK